MGFEIVGIILVCVAVLYSFYKKQNEIAFPLIITLFVLLYMVGYL